MTSRFVAVSLLATTWVVGTIYLGFVGQRQVALELLFYGGLAFWAALAWFGREILASKPPADNLSRQFATYGVSSVSSGLRPRGLMMMLLATATFAAVLGAAIGFFIAGQIGMAFAMLLASVAGAMAGTWGRVG